MPINIDLYRTGVGLLGDNPSGGSAFSGGTSALAWTAPDGLADGNTLTITTDGTYDFGSRINPSPIWWQRGSVAYNRSGEVTLLEASLSDGSVITEGVNASAFDTATGLTARTALGERSVFGYESTDTDAKLGSFSEMAVNQAVSTRKARWGFSARYSFDLSKVRTSSLSSSTGTFDDGDNTAFALGETFTGTKGTSGSFTGRIIKFDSANSNITFTVDGSYSSSDNNGASIVGDTSGATATFDGVEYIGGRSMKLTRSSSDPSVTPTNPEVALGFTVVSTGQNIVDIRRSDFGSDDERPNGLSMPDSNWHDFGFLVDYSSTDYKISQNVDGSQFSYTHTNPNSALMSEVAYQFFHTLFGCDWGGSDNDYGHLVAQIKDPYADDELAGIYIGDAATLASCTNLVYARSTAWSNSSATATVSFGEIPIGTTAYIYVRDDAGAFVSTSGTALGALS
ncbi:hypothetical protein A3765_28440 [Oleiphilus sp. HI0130]|nr:hypothetical protein A3765_29910 [Oleiphilus sp. HI0130]KZZ72481.1 hypothetical protein A3765_28440 [Oleiphilus sp. HI0130]